VPGVPIYRPSARRDRASRAHGALPRRRFIQLGLGVTAGALLPALPWGERVPQAKAATSDGPALYVVAHEDDSLLFQSPDLLHDIQSGGFVRTVVLTAGDGGLPESYWGSREAGLCAAYANMAGTANSWTSTSRSINGFTVVERTLVGLSKIVVNFLRLPDGGYPDGNGTATYGNQSLRKIWSGAISTITSVDKANTYSKDGLTATLTAFMSLDSSDRLSVQDYSISFTDNDHPDHVAAAYIAVAAAEAFTGTHTLTGYMGYGTGLLQANVTGSDLTAKSAAFYAYAPYDSSVCQSATACAQTSYAGWLAGQYTVDSSPSGAGTGDPKGVNVAGLATVTASSQNTDTGQTADKAANGVIDGYPGDYTKEWATAGGGAGSWLKLVWPTAQTLGSVVLYDRPNGADHITGGTLTFSDGSTVSVPPLPNTGGSGQTITFTPRATTSLLFTITSVSATTVNVGLAEIETWASTGSGSTPSTPVADAGPDASVTAGSTVTLDGSGSHSTDQGTVSYAWSQTSGPAVTLSSTTTAKPTFTAPASAATLVFALTLTEGSATSTADTVTITVTAATPSKNVAGLATVTASSQNTDTGQTADKAVNGVIDGYPGDYTKEWATAGGGAGSWLKLVWPTAQTLGSVVLYDRPNGEDQVTGGTLTFSDGSTVSVSWLDNTGKSGRTITFTPRTTTSLLFTVTSVSPTTVNIGLAEIQAWTA
jgi:LmbE family N-acetylglucosaminyl deacetylase